MTFHGKTYSNGYPLKGQKLMANERTTNDYIECANGLLNPFNGQANISNGLQKFSNVLVSFAGRLDKR